MRLAIVFAFLLGLAFPAFAAPACQFTLPDTVNTLNAAGTKYMILDEGQKTLFLADLAVAYEAKTGQKPANLDKVANVLLAVLEGEVFFGFEMDDGCLTPPTPLAEYLPAEKRSGYTPVGTFA